MPVTATSPKRGAMPSPRSDLAAATPFPLKIGLPPNFIRIPRQISMWGNDVHGDCVAAEEAFAKACNNPEVFVSDDEVETWASGHGVLEGANLTQVMQWMQGGGFSQDGNVYDDGPYFSVDWTNQSTLQSAIFNGPVKIGIAADQLNASWDSTDGKSGWFATGYKNDSGEDHCTSLCGYGSISWLASQLNVQVPSGIDGTKPGYAMFTWNSIGIIDEPSLIAITHEAWLRQPTTIIKTTNPLYQLHGDGSIWYFTGPPITGWQQLDNNPAASAIVAGGNKLYQLHGDGTIWIYNGPPMTGWQQLDNNPKTKSIVAAGSDLYQLHGDGAIWHYIGPPMTGWQQLDNNPATSAIVAGGGKLYQLHGDGTIWIYNGPPMTGWQQLDNNPRTKSIVADGSNLYQLHDDGTIWHYIGPPMTGWQQLDNNPAARSIAAGGGKLYQLHGDGTIWVYKGPPMTGWQQLDNNPAARAITADSGTLHQLHGDGTIWIYNGPPMTGWQQLDNNPKTVAIISAVA